MKKITRVAIVVDQSDSMRHLRDLVSDKTNDLIKKIRGHKEKDHTYEVGLYVFSQDVIGPMEKYPSTFMGQNTALLDAVGKAIEDLSGFDKPTRHIFPWEQSKDNVANLVIVLTDGEENASRFYRGSIGGSIYSRDYLSSRKMLPDIIQKKQDEGNWTLAFQLPPGKADRFSREFGIPRSNCEEWEGTASGFTEASNRTVNSISAYTALRASGVTKSTSFYVTPDLSNVKAKDIKQLDDMTSRFAQFRVDKEMDIKSFVELRTKKPYIPGTAFFQLTKPEKVQASKQVALIEHGKKAVLGGQQARDLIGLKPFTDAKVIPGNHGNYDIFVQSMSSNRKLVRGTKVLVIK